MAAKSLKLNFFYNVLQNVSKVLFPLITAPYVARVLSPDGLGLANFAGTYTGYFVMVALIGLPTHGMREIAKFRDDIDAKSKTVSEIFSLSMILTAAVSIIYFLTLMFASKLRNDAVIFLITGLGLYFIPTDMGWYFSGEERFGFLTLRHLIVRTLAIICLFLFVHTKKDLAIYVIINTLSGVLGQIWSFILMLKDGIRVKFTIHGLVRHLNPALILFASTIATSIYTMLDTIMLGFIKDYSDVAYYNCAGNISKTVVALVTSLSAVAVPRISYYLQNGEKEKINELINKSLSIVSYLAIPAAIGLACIAPVFSPLFYGDQYYGAIVPLQIMSFVIIAIGLNNLTTWQTLIGLGKDKEFLLVICVGAVTNLLTNLVLIPKFGAEGASVASVFAEFCVLAASVVAVYKCTFVRYVWFADMAKALAASLLFIPLLILLSKIFSGWILVGTFCITGFVIYVGCEQLLKNRASKIVNDTVIELADKFKNKK